ICDYAVPPANAVYSNDIETLINTVPLRGEQFKRDNEKVYGIIKSLVLEGPGWNWIIQLDRSRDGREAWKALKAHYEGESVLNRNKEEAYASIASAQCQGEQRNFTFETYTNVHQKAHQDLKRLDEAVPEAKKVRDFLSNIHDPQLAAGKSTVLATPKMLEDFTEASNFLANFVVRTKSMSRNERQVSAVEGGRGRGNRTGRGRGRGRGRGARGNCTGRGTNDSVTDKHYTPHEWAKLSQEQKAKVMQLRDNKKRSASVMTSDKSPDDADHMEKETDNAGDQFGRNAHVKK
ncbi:MAG: hypothetical protein ACRDL7_03340, partial [Gaiellaceae bacterium]